LKGRFLLFPANNGPCASGMHVHGVAVKFPELLYCLTWRVPCNLIIVKTIYACFNLHQLWFQCT